MQTAHLLSTLCSSWFVIFCSKIWVQNVFLSSLCHLLVFSPPCFKCSFSTMHHACNVSYEVKVWVFSMKWECEHSLKCERFLWNVSMWSQRSFCEIEGLRLKVWSQRCEVWGLHVKSKVWGLRSPCQVKVGGVRLKVKGLRFLCQVWGLRSMAWNVKLFVWGWRYFCARSEVKVWQNWSFEFWSLSLWGLRFKLECFLWGLTSKRSLWGLKSKCLLLFVKFEVWMLITFCKFWSLNV
jgi:hypothetical protein